MDGGKVRALRRAVAALGERPGAKPADTNGPSGSLTLRPSPSVTVRGHDRRFRQCRDTALIHVGADGVCTVCGRLIREPRPPALGWPHPIPEEEKDIPDGQARAGFALGIAALVSGAALLVWVVAWTIGRMA